MFTVDCPIRAATVLVWPSQLIGITNTAEGLELHFRCSCRQPAVLVTGRRAAGEVLHHPATAAGEPLAA